MMGWQLHQLDRMQIICTLLQTDNHASTSPLNQLTVLKFNHLNCMCLITFFIYLAWFSAFVAPG